jgi:3-phenylpropionate/trans-cinnamate dioxygenase ferredoxin reductase subunit
MSKMLTVTVNGEAFSAYRGDLLLDAALQNGVDIPHDCRSGHCGTCRVEVVQGMTFGGDTAEPGAVRACQCRVVSDLDVVIEDVPEIETINGKVVELIPAAPDVVEVWIEPQKPLFFLPGQYLQVQYKGFPMRCYSPTAPLDNSVDDLVRLHVRRVPNGRVSGALGREIREGHKVKLTGPFGSAYLRPGLTNRLILVASGTGFAPIWSVADAAMNENPNRELVMIVGARTIDSLYMVRALCWLAACPNVWVVPCVDKPQSASDAIRIGKPTEYIPQLRPDDILYACGGPAMVEAVATMAKAAGAKCYMDAFVPPPDEGPGLMSRVLSFLTSGASAVSSPPMAPSSPRPARSQKPRQGWPPRPGAAPRPAGGSYRNAPPPGRQAPPPRFGAGPRPPAGPSRQAPPPSTRPRQRPMSMGVPRS